MNDQQLLRYSRHIMLPQMDISGQEKLLASTVLLVGLGGLGSPAALYLAAAGVGTLILVDHDAVDLSNMQRQIVHRMEFIGHPKVESAAAALRGINPEIKLVTVAGKVDSALLDHYLPEVDVVLDGSDNFPTRFLVNRLCWGHQVPLVSAAAIRGEGQISVFDPADPTSPCYQCLYPDAEDEAQGCAENGVLAPLVGVLGSLQALEAIKLLSNVGDPLVGRLQIFDGLSAQWRTLTLNKDQACSVCCTMK